MVLSSSRLLLSTFSILLSAAFLSSCTTSNIHNDASISSINSLSDAQAVIKPGMNMPEVRSLLGDPGFTNTFNQTTMWTYQSRKTKVNSGRKLISLTFTGYLPADTKNMTVHFNAAGLVERVDYNQQSF